MIPLKAKLIVGAIGVGIIVLGALYVRNLQVDNAELTRKNGELTTSLETKKEELRLTKLDYESIKLQRTKLQKINKELAKDLSSLDEKFNKVRANGTKRDIGAAAVRYPKIVQKIINKGTADANRCVEIASGDEIKDDEKNSICQNLIDSKKL